MIEKRKYLSISWLKANILNNKEYEQTDTMNFGSLVDCLLYTPDRISNFNFYNTDKITDLISQYKEMDWIDFVFL